MYDGKCICGKTIPYTRINSSMLCIDCIEARTKISGYIGSGKIQID